MAYRGVALLFLLMTLTKVFSDISKMFIIQIDAVGMVYKCMQSVKKKGGVCAAAG
jgi:hypothetical protein